jgi:hypothetical protein
MIVLFRTVRRLPCLTSSMTMGIVDAPSRSIAQLISVSGSIAVANRSASQLTVNSIG